MPTPPTAAGRIIPKAALPLRRRADRAAAPPGARYPVEIQRPERGWARLRRPEQEAGPRLPGVPGGRHPHVRSRGPPAGQRVLRLHPDLCTVTVHFAFLVAPLFTKGNVKIFAEFSK